VRAAWYHPAHHVDFSAMEELADAALAILANTVTGTVCGLTDATVFS
jgi:hypothetical protein